LRRIDARPRTIGQLRKFGLVMAGAFAGVGGVLLWRERAAWPVPLVLAALFLVLGVAAPGALRTVERGWMALGERLSVVSTFVLLTLAFLLALTPLGMVSRLAGRDRLRLRRREESYWVPVDSGPSRRPDRPY
jgi:hypothetical protein